MKEEKIIVLEEKTFIERHAKKILLGAGLITAAGVYYLLNKHDMDIDSLKNINNKLKNDNETLMMAASEGLYEEAIATVTRKINTSKDKIEWNRNRLLDRPNDIQSKEALDKYISKLDMLSIRKDRFIAAQKIYEISTEY